jgi:hypothetical protein
LKKSTQKYTTTIIAGDTLLLKLLQSFMLNNSQTTVIRKGVLDIHPFDSLCKKNHIQHRLTKFHHRWTNGMVERFNRKLKVNVVRRHLFEDRAHLEQELLEYTNKYNFMIKLQGLNGCTPVEFLIKNHSSKLLKPPQRIVS